MSVSVHPRVGHCGIWTGLGYLRSLMWQCKDEVRRGQRSYWWHLLYWLLATSSLVCFAVVVLFLFWFWFLERETELFEMMMDLGPHFFNHNKCTSVACIKVFSKQSHPRIPVCVVTPTDQSWCMDTCMFIHTYVLHTHIHETLCPSIQPRAPRHSSAQAFLAVCH